jgi:hypothetical protein
MEAFSARAAFPLVAIPFDIDRVSTFVGLLIVKFFGSGPWAAVLAVGLAIRAFHPPAGIDPPVVVVNDMSWDFLVAPVGIGALLLALFAFSCHNLVAQGANRGNTCQQGGGELCDRPIPTSFLRGTACASQSVSRKIYLPQKGGLGRNEI